MRVFDMKMGEVGVIESINLDGSALERLRALGIREGEKLEVISFSLLKSSVLVSCGAVRVGLRKSLAQQIEVKV